MKELIKNKKLSKYRKKEDIFLKGNEIWLSKVRRREEEEEEKEDSQKWERQVEDYHEFLL